MTRIIGCQLRAAAGLAGEIEPPVPGTECDSELPGSQSNWRPSPGPAGAVADRDPADGHRVGAPVTGPGAVAAAVLLPVRQWTCRAPLLAGTPSRRCKCRRDGDWPRRRPGLGNLSPCPGTASATANERLGVPRAQLTGRQARARPGPGAGGHRYGGS